jgi:uncharacterized membrane protein
VKYVCADNVDVFIVLRVFRIYLLEKRRQDMLVYVSIAIQIGAYLSGIHMYTCLCMLALSKVERIN